MTKEALTETYDLAYDPGVITVIALEMDRTHPLVPAHEISPGASSGFSGPWDDSVRHPASSLSHLNHLASSQESVVQGRSTSPRTSSQSRLGPREFSKDASECAAFCTIQPYSPSLHQSGTPLSCARRLLSSWQRMQSSRSIQPR